MANKVTIKNGKYTVESIYQWDKGQVLEIYGLSLPSKPEIHFTNDTMDRAIVRKATMNSAGVITVNIPNSLLQKPYTIKAYVCICEGDTFESLYQLIIPVKARKKPADYTLEVTDEEVYSFHKLEDMVLNCVSDNEKIQVEINNTCKTTIDSVNEKCNDTVESVNEKCNDTVTILTEKYNEVKEYCDSKVDTFSNTNVTPLPLSPSQYNTVLRNDLTYILRGGWARIKGQLESNILDSSITRKAFLIPKFLVPAEPIDVFDVFEVIAHGVGTGVLKTCHVTIVDDDPEDEYVTLSFPWTISDEREADSWWYDFNIVYPLPIPEE